MFSHVTNVTLGVATIIVSAFFIGYKFLAGPLTAAQVYLQSITVWEVLSALAPILAPIISLALLFIGKVIWNHEKRIRSAEQDKTRQSRTLYGDENDPQQDGLAQDINSLSRRVESLEDAIDRLRDDLNDD